MDKLKKQREVLRTLIIETISDAEVELASVVPNKVNLEAVLTVLMENEATLSELDKEIQDNMMDNTQMTPALMGKEAKECQGHRLMFSSIRIKVNNYLNPVVIPTGDKSRHGSGSSGVSSITSHKRNFKLPKVELKKFSGELKEWLGWWAQFKKIHDDEDLHVADKFDYLDQCMVKGSKAEELVFSYPHSIDNYEKVIEAMNRRFGNKKILKQLYVRELITMISVNRNKEKWSLSSHFDRLESHLRSLESLGVSVEQMVIFLYPMVESSLPEETLIAWQHSRNFGKDESQEEPPRSELDFLLEFIKDEIELEVQRKIARVGFQGQSVTSEKKGQRKKDYGEEDLPTSAGLFSATSTPCIFCDKTNHSSSACFRAGKMTLEQKRSKVNSKKACHWCLKARHAKGKCPADLKCTVCGRRHLTIMCPGEVQKATENSGTGSETTTTTTSVSLSSEVVLETIMVNLVNPTLKTTRRVRAFLDSGSQRSYILKKTAEALGLTKIGNQIINHQVFGGGKIPNVDHQIFDVVVASTESRFSTRISILDHDKICGPLPRLTKGSWIQELKKKGIRVNDCNTKDPKEIELMLGTDRRGRLLTGKIVQLEEGLTATETRFGWCITGPVGSENESATNLANSIISMSVCSNNLPDLWKLETLGIRDPIEVKSQEERDVSAYQHFQKTVQRNSDGRYKVSLPWIDIDVKIPSNRLVAEKRLESTTRKLIAMDKFRDYDAIFKAWEAEGIISRVGAEDGGSDKCHYLPHRAVLKESRTTPVRPVFDASCKIGRAPSLNECLERGPNLLEVIPAILMRFRMKKIGIVSDIRKAFQMIELQEQDQDAVRFIWWEDAERKKMVTFRHNRVVFGMNCSPFLLGAVLNHHLNQKKAHHPEIVTQMSESIYVDNCATSVESEDAYHQFKVEATELLDEMKMELRQWEYTGDNSEDRITSVLGLKWDKFQDSLFCAPLINEISTKITKRLILSRVQQVFDPLGFLSPVLVLPKILLQKSWMEQRGWEEEVTEEERKEFKEWWDELLPMLDKFRLPRRVTGEHDGKGTFQLHVFCDASKAAYAAAAFLRVKSEEGVTVQLIQSKSRVTPLKKSTIPRLELLACSIAARLASSVQKALDIEEVPIKFWTDSTTALSWIRNSDDWGTFVGNRVKEIVSLTEAKDWKHVPGRLNPADLPSRGISPSKFLELKWWEGPSWLRKEECQWPSSEPAPDEEEVSKEKKRSSINMVVSSEACPWYLFKNSYSHSLRVVSLVRRFIGKLRKSSAESDQEPSADEIDKTERHLWTLVQSESFPNATAVINGVNVVRDESGLLRVKTKLLHRKDSAEFRYPVLLPGSHPLVQLMIKEMHWFNCHAGAQFLMCNIREKCWLLQGKRAVRKVINKCVICQRFTAKNSEVPTASLPEDRVKDAGAFDVTGIDLAGPLVLRDESKVWIVLYTCAVYRCVHLELVDGLSTEDLLLSFIRFCKRKKRPSIIYTDRGTNFRGADNDFKDIDWKEVKKRTNQQRIDWHFNPPAAPWWGGWWERLIRSMKDLLKRMLGFRKLSKVELETCLCEVEATINHRPLTFVTEDSEDLIPLTPAMFIHSLSGGDEVPEARVLTVELLAGKKKRMDQLLRELQERFRKEYLALLVQKPKKKQCREFRVGDCVLIGKEKVKRILWPMGRIMELVPGKDGICRVAKLRVKNGTLVRPLQRLYPLEISQEESVFLTKARAISTQDEASEEVEPTESGPSLDPTEAEAHRVPSIKTTRSGRAINKPKVWDCYSSASAN